MLSKMVTIKNAYDKNKYYTINLDNVCFAEYDPDAEVYADKDGDLFTHKPVNESQLVQGSLTIYFNNGISETLKLRFWGINAETLHKYMINAGQWIGVP